MPRTGYNQEYIKKIKDVLSKSKSGMTIAEIYRSTKVPQPTVWFYINRYKIIPVEIIKEVKGSSRKKNVCILYKLKEDSV